MCSNVQYIHVPICVLYSVQYSVQYSLGLRARSNLHESGWGLFFGGNVVPKAFCMYGISFFVEYSEQYSEQFHGQFIVKYSVQCSGQHLD